MQDQVSPGTSDLLNSNLPSGHQRDAKLQGLLKMTFNLTEFPSCLVRYAHLYTGKRTISTSVVLQKNPSSLCAFSHGCANLFYCMRFCL